MLVYDCSAAIEGNVVTSGPLATIFSDNGLTEINQSDAPVKTSDLGFFEFWTGERRVTLQPIFQGQRGRAIRDVDIPGDLSGELNDIKNRLALAEQSTHADTITALADIDPEPNKGIMFDSEGAMAMFDVTPAARALLDDPDVETMRQTLGIEEGGGSGTGSPYFVSGFFTNAPTAVQTLTIHVFAADVTFEDNFAGLRLTCGSWPSADFTLSVRQDNMTIGTIKISPTGTITGNSIGSNAITFLAGQVMEIVAPVGTDAWISNCAFTLQGVRA